MASVKIALIEDELSIRQLYQSKLELEGFEVIVSENASDGLRQIKITHPDIVLLDLRLPGMSGHEMLAKMRAEEWGADIRVIILTNVSRDEAPASLRFLGVSRYIVKAHHTPTQIVEMVRDTLGIK